MPAPPTSFLLSSSSPPPLRPPPYIRSYLPSVLLHPLPRQLRLSHLTLGQGFLVLLYTLLISLFTFALAPPTRDPSRSGLIATAQIPLVVLLGLKSSPLAPVLLGKGAEKVNFLHRLAGRLVFGGSTVHAAVYCAWACACAGGGGGGGARGLISFPSFFHRTPRPPPTFPASAVLRIS